MEMAQKRMMSSVPDADVIITNPTHYAVALKYNNKTKDSAIRTLTRISKPGLRKYSGVDTLPRVLNGLGIAIVSTSKGLITDKEARNLNVGGEVICHIY